MTEIVTGTLLLTLIIVALGLVVVGVRALVLPSRRVAIVVNGGEPLPAMTGSSLLNVLNEAGVPVPSACAGAGTCGLCRVRITKGGGDPSPTELSRLSRAEARDGMRLACQVGVRNDLAVEVSPDLLDVESFTCTVHSSKPLSPLIREIVLDVPEGQSFEARAGAFVQVTAPPYTLAYADIEVDDAHRSAWDRMGLSHLTASTDEPVSRAYSLANRPEDTNRVVLFIRLAVPPPSEQHAPPGIVSSWLFGLKPGDKVEVSGPYGDFGAAEGDREMVLIGGGVGMAPLRAIIHDQLERVGTTRKISFWYGARSRLDLFYADAFDDLAARYPNFSWTAALSDPTPEDDWQGPTGFVHKVTYDRYLKTHPAPENCEYYLCGPPLMIQAVLGMLDECGVDDESIFNDDFGS